MGFFGCSFGCVDVFMRMQVVDIQKMNESCNAEKLRGIKIFEYWKKEGNNVLIFEKRIESLREKKNQDRMKVDSKFFFYSYMPPSSTLTNLISKTFHENIAIKIKNNHSND